MNSFSPGKVVAKIQLEDSSEVIIRYPIWEDLDSMTDYINQISSEDTFIALSGEMFNKYDESQYLASKFVEMENQNGVTLFAIHGDKIVGVAGISRNTQNRQRTYHRGIFAISVAQEYRGLGIGKVLTTETIETAKKETSGLKIIELEVFKINTAAVGLYQKLGFETFGEFKDGYYYKDNYHDVILMNLKI